MSSSSKKTYEDEFSEFLIKKISLAGGSLQVQHITGHLSQVRHQIREAIGTSISDILHFLEKHKHLFFVDKHIVHLAKSSRISSLEYDSDSSDRSYSNLPSRIESGKGVIVKLFSDFGFIKSKDPIKTEIYFKSYHFSNKDVDLTSSLYIGAVVFFDAMKYGKLNCIKSKCKYRATKVWRTDSDFERATNIQKSRKTRDTGLYDPLHLDSDGIIQNVFPNLGFISVKGDNHNTVFFHKNRVQNYDNIVDLTKVFSKGDRVEFNAHRSSKADAKARWEATKVWKMGKELNKTESDSDQTVNQTSVLNQLPIAHIKSNEMKRNQHGKICPRAHGAVIKFNEHELADGDSAVYYVCGTQVTDIGWEFSEGDDVYFDAVKIKSAPGWKAVLVWTGKKPDIVLPTCLGDFTAFNTDEEDNGEICSSIYTSKSSSYMSESCSSSVKTESVSSKTEDFTKENTPTNSAFIVNKESKSSIKKQYKNWNTPSEDSSISSSSKRTSHLKKSKQLADTSQSKSVIRGSCETLSNWGDSPYPDDRTYKNIGRAESFETHVTMKTADNMIEVTDDEFENTSEYASVHEDKIVEKKKGENFACKDSKFRENIKRFHNVDGKIVTVYSKFAEVKSSNLENPVSFYLNDFYINGMSAEELEFDDLKEVLKVGDSIRYNCFTIVDDLGQIWQKVTMAWLGLKPKGHKEMSVEDFIHEHNLSVTVNDEPGLSIKCINISKTTKHEAENTSEYASAVEEEITVERKRDENFSCKNSEYTENIKKFQNVNGKITTVYSKFAEVKSNNLENPISFFLNDFYLNGMSAEELELDELKDVLDIGDSIRYNYFTIVDDFGQIWQRVTMAWLGSEPKDHHEMNAEDFIHENNLSVTINNEPDLAIKSANNIINIKENDVEKASECADAVGRKEDEKFPCKNSEFRERIKKFHNVNGKITTVYSKFAEVKSSNLENTVSFFLNDFYLNGVSAEELEVDDLKQILKVGDNISYNFFIIIDDFDQSFQKVTMAWHGSKPKKHQEMSAEDFIQDHDLSVTIINQFENEEILENKNDCRKFLTSFDDEVPNNHSEKLSRTESCSDGESLNFKLESQHPDATDHPADFKGLSSAVSKILKRDVFTLHSVVDFNSVSDEIINLILKSGSVKNVPSSDMKCLSCMNESASLSSKTVSTKNTEVQTIITGDIIAQNICTDC